jgi:hypothetical protein
MSTKARAMTLAAFVFTVAFIKLGFLGYLVIGNPVLLALYVAAAVGFAAWIFRQTYHAHTAAAPAVKRLDASFPECGPPGAPRTTPFNRSMEMTSESAP